MSISGLILKITVIILVAAGCSIFYYVENRSWQEDYRSRVTEGIVDLLQTNPYDQQAVVLIVIDGLRWNEGIGAEDAYIPFIYNELRPKGALLTNYYIQSPTVTTSSHSAMLTGRISTVPNDGHIRPVFPNFMEQFRDARLDFMSSTISEITSGGSIFFHPDSESRRAVGEIVADAMEFGPEKTAMYLGKDLIYSLNQSSSGRFPADDVLLVDSMRDIEVREYFRAKIPDEKPAMVLVNLGDTDESGHEAQWHYYVDAIRGADEQVRQMWEALQAETRYRDKTYFIVTTDHGRHVPERGGFPHHGDFCEGCRQSFALIIGPGIRQGVEVNTPHSELDIAPTIAALMGFEMPAATGNVITEIFEDSISLPDVKLTSADYLVEEDRQNVDDRDTVKILRDRINEQFSIEEIENTSENAIALMALCETSMSDDELAYLANIGSVLHSENMHGGMFPQFLLYPMIRISDLVEISDPTLATNLRTIVRNFINAGPDYVDHDPGAYKYLLVEGIAAVALGRIDNDPAMTGYGYSWIFPTLWRFESREKVMDEDFEDFIDDYGYRQEPNVLFTEEELSIRDKMWIMWALERTIAESNPEHDPESYYLLLRQYRLMAAFVHYWQDANSVVGGTGDIGEEIDFVAQGLCLASMADFQPWRRWELDALGYSPNIYATPLFDFPPHHFFYILGQGNALAGCWAANERMRLYVNDDGSIRHDLLDSASPLKPGDEKYLESAAALAYGLKRFESADFGMFDLELYPIVHQVGVE